MFIGHYGVSFAIKRAAPNVSLGALFVAVQALDLIFAVDVMDGLEKMRLIPHFTAYNSYDLYWMPWSHSLFAAVLWSVLAAASWWAFTGKSPARLSASVVVGVVVLSHWLLDFPVHTRDLQLWPWNETRVGLGLWNHRSAALAAELLVLLLGVAVYVRARPAPTRAGRLATWGFIGALGLIALATPFLPDPPSTNSWAVQALLAYLLLALLAAGVERARRPARAG
jgi:hypothetical protein